MGGGPAPVEIGRLLLFDDFEYDVDRSATDAEQQFRAHGWTDAKAINSHFGRGSGYLYTRFDPIRNSRVLVMESYPSTAYNPPNFPYRQTDYGCGTEGNWTDGQEGEWFWMVRAPLANNQAMPTWDRDKLY